MTKTTKLNLNIFSENINDAFDIDEKKAIDVARNVLNFYINTPDIYTKCCLFDYQYNCISFDILYCDSVKTHKINIEYREKDYPADIITFAIFADSEEKFVFDGEINLGEIIIALDKVQKNSEDKKVTFEDELYFLISHGIMHLLGFDHQTEEDYNFIIHAQNSALKNVRGEA